MSLDVIDYTKHDISFSAVPAKPGQFAALAIKVDNHLTALLFTKQQFEELERAIKNTAVCETAVG